jgi:hypothetical protein
MTMGSFISPLSQARPRGRAGKRGGHQRALWFVLLAVAALALVAFPASARAWTSAYELKIKEGESTLPEYESVASTSATDPEGSRTEVVLSIVRGGTTVYRTIGQGGAWLAQVPAPGETVDFESPAGTPIASVVYDGKPTLASSVCAGSSEFSGEDSPGDTVEGFYSRYQLRRDPYGRVNGTERTQFGEAQVKTLSGSSFGGDFLQPLELGQDVTAVESIKTLLGNGSTYAYTSEYERPVGGCPPPPPPPPLPAPAPAPLLGGLLKLSTTTIEKLLKFGWHDEVSINQPGTIVQDLYLQDGTLPAEAATASRRHHAKAPRALLLASGSVRTSTAASVTVVLHLTKQGRERLRSMKGVHVVLLTTLHGSSGAAKTLAGRTIWLHR